MDPEESIWQGSLHMTDLFFGGNFCSIQQMNLYVITKALNIEQVIKSHLGCLPVGTNCKITLVELRLFFL